MRVASQEIDELNLRKARAQSGREVRATVRCACHSEFRPRRDEESLSAMGLFERLCLVCFSTSAMSSAQLASPLAHKRPKSGPASCHREQESRADVTPFIFDEENEIFTYLWTSPS